MKMMFDPCHGVHHRPIHNYIHINLYIHLGGCVTSNISVSLSSVTVPKEGRASKSSIHAFNLNTWEAEADSFRRNFWEVSEG